MNILTAIHRAGRIRRGCVKELNGREGEKRLRAGDHRVRFTEGVPDKLRIHTVKNRKDAHR